MLCRLFGRAILVAASCVLPARAQLSEPTVRIAPAVAAPGPDADKSGYTLFSPTPGSAMRSFSTDRPNKSNSPFTVDAGHFQYETDLFNYLHSNAGGARARLFTVADPVLKVGVTNYADVEISLGGYQNLRSVDRATGAVTRADGFGDVQLRAKINVIGNDGGFVAAAVIPYIKLPTSSRNLGNNQVEGGLIVPLQLNLPHDFALILMTEIDIFKNGANSGKHANFTNLVNLSHAIYGDLSGSVEFASSVGPDAGNKPIYTLDLALSEALTPNLQLDAATYIGLNRNAPNLVLYTGLSQRF